MRDLEKYARRDGTAGACGKAKGRRRVEGLTSIKKRPVEGSIKHQIRPSGR